jgi:hypothetical protein
VDSVAEGLFVVNTLMKLCTAQKGVKCVEQPNNYKLLKNSAPFCPRNISFFRTANRANHSAAITWIG